MDTYDVTVEEHPEEEYKLRHKANHYMTSRDGGHEIDLLRVFALEGMQLNGRVATIEDGGALRLRANLPVNLDSADTTYRKIRSSIDQYIADNHLDAPPAKPFKPVWLPAYYTTPTHSIWTRPASSPSSGRPVFLATSPGSIRPYWMVTPNPSIAAA